MKSCTTCGRPPESVCDPCAEGNPPPERLADLRRQAQAELSDTLRDALTNLPDAYALLALFMLPGSTPPDPEKRSGTTSPARPPLRMDVVSMLDQRLAKYGRLPVWDEEGPDRFPMQWRNGRGVMSGSPAERSLGVRGTLAAMTRRVDGDMWDAGFEHQPPDEDPSVAGECSWLMTHARWLVEQMPGADKLVADIKLMFDDVCRATGWSRPEPNRCPKCGWTVKARDGGKWWSCTGCPMTWAREAEINRFVADQEYVKTLRECAAEVGRPVSSLKEWRSRGWITSIATSMRGVQLFDVRKVSEVAGRVAPGRLFKPTRPTDGAA